MLLRFGWCSQTLPPPQRARSYVTCPAGGCSDWVDKGWKSWSNLARGLGLDDKHMRLAAATKQAKEEKRDPGHRVVDYPSISTLVVVTFAGVSEGLRPPPPGLHPWTPNCSFEVCEMQFYFVSGISGLPLRSLGWPLLRYWRHWLQPHTQHRFY
jgi:hypothetical protein